MPNFEKQGVKEYSMPNLKIEISLASAPALSGTTRKESIPP
jgi:hypothetical protein